MQKFINNWSTILIEPLSPSDTAIAVDTDSTNRLRSDFQQGDYYILTLDDGMNIEIIYVENIINNRLLVSRAQEQSLRKSWGKGTKAEVRVTAKSLNTFSTLLDAALTIEGDVLVSPEGNILYL